MFIKSIPKDRDKPDDFADENGPPDLNENNNFNNNKINKTNDLRKKRESLIQEIINSKAKLKKYNLYYSIIEICNIIFALIISFFIINRLYKYYKSRKNRINQNNNNIISVVDIDNHDIDIIKRNLNEISIYKQSFEIKAENNIVDKGEAPPLTFNP